MLILGIVFARQRAQITHQAHVQADCKVYPVTTASATGVRKPNVSPIEQRYAEMQLANSEYRMRNLRENGYDRNNVEDALRDCATR